MRCGLRGDFLVSKWENKGGGEKGDFLSYAPGDPLIGELGDPSMEEREQRDPCPSSLLSYILLDHIFRI